jgi:hypothetical protein
VKNTRNSYILGHPYTPAAVMMDVEFLMKKTKGEAVVIRGCD